MKVSILRKRSSDEAFLRSLGQRAFGEYDSAAGEHAVRLGARRDALTLVACAEERPVGFAIVRLRGTASSLDAIAVDEASRGAGVGKRLLRAAEAEAERRGATEIGLVTAAANLSALDLFLKAGFRIEERLPRYYRRGQDAVRLRKRW
jgi:ribosomal protein S18 acetylase RimI-like enzyme